MSSTERPLVPSCSARSLANQLPSVPSLIPRSRATCAIGFPVSRTIRTAPSRNSWSYFLRFSDMTTPHSACLHGFGGGSVGRFCVHQRDGGCSREAGRLLRRPAGCTSPRWAGDRNRVPARLGTHLSQRHGSADEQCTRSLGAY